jgi:septal ring-binding cell division protein DamX
VEAAALTAEQLRRMDGYGAGGNPLLRERLASTREKLLTAPDGGYSIELFSTENSEPARTERFLARARDLVPLSEIYVVPVSSKSRYQLRVTYGAFATREAAAQAAKRLPPKYQNAFRFELRSFSEIRASI